ncbi:MAG: Trk system potassium transporter TrkA [Candidatus Algichlamydia australiensis]|nr:Trk system potassium transporter TrkA [Chlamydiales bacterium]
MSIVIAGAEELGTYLASVLSDEQQNVIIIDPDEEKLEQFARSADVATVCGTCHDWQLLDRIVEQKPQLFLAMSSCDATNLLACSIAKNLGYPTTVCRITNASFLDQSRLDIDRLFYVDHLIAPELIVAHELFKCLSHPGSIAVESFAHGAVQMRTIVLPSEFPERGKTLRELKFGDDLLIGMIRRKRENGGEIIFPHGDDKLEPGDEVTFVGDTSTMMNIPSRFGLRGKEIKSAVVAGSSPVVHHLAKILLGHGIGVKVMDSDLPRCEQLAKIEGNITVIQQDPSNIKFLLSERVDQSDVFLAATPSTEFNILTASLAQEAGVSDVYSLVSDMRHSHLLKRLGIDYAVSEKECITSRILSFIHAESAISTRTLYENRVMIMELKVSSGTKIAGVPVRDLGHLLPKDCLIALIENRGQIMIAKGNRIFAPGDTVIIICSPKHVDEIKGIF